jgi:hypothetical protein
MKVNNILEECERIGKCLSFEIFQMILEDFPKVQVFERFSIV